MTKPLPDKAEVPLEYPDKLYIGTFDRTSRFDAHLDATGLSLNLERTGASDTRKTVHLHLNYGLLDLPEIQIFYCAPCQHVETIKSKQAA
jgi:hypothetical protein